MNNETEKWENADSMGEQNPRHRPKDRPVKEFREGSIKAAIWKRTYEEKTFYNVSISRSFRVPAENAGDDGWRESVSFDLADLEIVKLVCEMAGRWIKQAKIESV